MFKEIPADKRSWSRRTSLFGVGINDADYVVYRMENGKQVSCPYHTSWRNMLKRCYCEDYQKKQPTYKGCTVCDEWLTFTNFRAWMKTQEWEGKELDKDIIKFGNKVYAPDMCLFVTRAINSLLNYRRETRCPQGVYFCKDTHQHRAEIIASGVKTRIGRFDTADAASVAYKHAKAVHVRAIAAMQSQPLQSALMRHAEALSC